MPSEYTGCAKICNFSANSFTNALAYFTIKKIKYEEIGVKFPGCAATVRGKYYSYSRNTQ